MSNNRFFVNVFGIFLVLLLTACGTTSAKETLTSNLTPDLTASPDYRPEIKSYRIDLPVSSLDRLPQEEIATRLFNGWLEQFKPANVDIRIRLQDFKIQTVTIPPEFQSCTKGLELEFISTVKFSVLPSRTPAPDWVAGSGTSGGDGWINDKTTYIGIFKTPDFYSFRLLGVPPCGR